MPATQRASAKKDGSAQEEDPLAADEQWIPKVDLKAFKEDMQALGQRLHAGQGQDDLDHFNKILLWSNAFTISGILCMGLHPLYIFPWVLLSTGTFSRWTMIAHHTCHGGYDKVDHSGRFNRRVFALGTLYRRMLDWFDWMLPEAWNVEHNNLHHYHLGEITDPDLVENNTKHLRDSNLPMYLKHAAVAFFMATWKWFYYAPNTFKELKAREAKSANVSTKGKAGYELSDSMTLLGMLFFRPFEFLSGWEFVSQVAGPYFVYRFLVLPMPMFFVGFAMGVGTQMYWYAVINMMLAEICTNFHAFLAIVTNHAGHDMYRFATHCRPKTGAFYLRQVISSVDFAAGTDAIDFFHGFLNYQIEHHLWPDLSMLSYQRSMPEVKKICAKHGVPYIQENVFIRLKKTVDIMTGATSMRRYPIQWEIDE